MRGTAWAALLRHIPPDDHNILMVVTRCGTEIALQNILRIDEEFVAVKGRLAGSQDAGRLYFIPYDNIDYCGYNRVVKEEEFHTVYGGLAMPAEEPAVAELLEIPDEPPTPVAAAAPPSSEPPPAPPKSPSRARLAIKSAVLERFRSRTNGSGAPPLSDPPSA